MAPIRQRRRPKGAPPRKTGRPSKIDEPVRKLMIEAVRMGKSIEDAVIWARGQGFGHLSRRTIYGWLKRKDAAGEDFRTELSHARVQGSMLRIAQIQEAARTGRVTRHYDASGNVVRETVEPGDWRAAAWLESRMNPAEFGSDRNPLYLLHRLREMAERASDENERAAWQHIMDVVARSLARLQPFGVGVKLPDEEADEAALQAQFQEEGLTPDEAVKAIALLQEIDARQRAKVTAHAGNGTPVQRGPPGNGTPPPAQKPKPPADWGFWTDPSAP